MDTKGARVLAERIAAGPPPEEGEEKPRPSEPPAVSPTLGEEQDEPPPAAFAVEIVYLKPHPARRRDVRIYVRGPDGRLGRSES